MYLLLVLSTIGLACDAMRRYLPVWKSKAISASTEVRTYECLVLGVLMYNSETWTMTAETQRKLLSFEMSCLRKIAGVSKRDRKGNEDIKDDLGIKEDVVDKIHMKRLRYFGHVCRMEQRRLPYVCLHGRIQGHRERGRPRKR